jgi:hypothetical protein
VAVVCYYGADGALTTRFVRSDWRRHHGLDQSQAACVCCWFEQRRCGNRLGLGELFCDIAVRLMFVRGRIQAVADNLTSRVFVGLSLRSEMG